MPYPTPKKTFDAIEHAKNKVLRANQFQELVIAQYKAAYEDFWGVEPDKGSKYSAAEMQSILEAMPMAIAIDILQDSASFNSYIAQAYPDQLDAKYRESAWNYTLGPGGITVTGVKQVWMPPVKEEEGNEPTPV